MRKLLTKINILGTEYKVFLADKKDKDLIAQDGADGFCDHSKKIILIDDNDRDSIQYKEHVLLHEAVHAFLHESGLRGQGHAGWAHNEEIVDWIASMIPKITIANKKMLKEYVKEKRKPRKKRTKKEAE